MKLRKTFTTLCKWGALALCLLLVVQALPLRGYSDKNAAETPAETPNTTDTPEDVIYSLLNEARIKAGKPVLSRFSALTAAANARALELSRTFSHTRPDGRAGFTVLEEHNISIGVAAENLALGYTDPMRLFADFTKSAEHNANLLGDFQHIGIGYDRAGGGFVLLFVGGCEAHALTVESEDTAVLPNTPLAELPLSLVATCTAHGRADLPLTSATVVGYDSAAVGLQEVTAAYGSVRTPFTLQVGETAANQPLYTDVPSGAWYAGAVQTLVAAGVLTEGGSFLPSDNLSRATLVTMLGRMAKIDVTAYARSVFSDVPAEAWYAPYVTWAYEKGIVSGYGGGKFLPDGSVSREQLCTFLVRFAGAVGAALPTSGGDAFTDSARISSWAKHAVSICAKAGLMRGDTDGKFRPQDTVTRAESASVLAAFLQTAVKTA